MLVHLQLVSMHAFIKIGCFEDKGNSTYVSTSETCCLMRSSMASKHAQVHVQVNASVTREMIAKAQETGLFFSAALWTRFFPATQT